MVFLGIYSKPNVATRPEFTEPSYELFMFLEIVRFCTEESFKSRACIYGK